MALSTDPKTLELMLQKVGIDVRWDADKEVFRRSETRVLSHIWFFNRQQAQHGHLHAPCRFCVAGNG